MKWFHFPRKRQRTPSPLYLQVQRHEETLHEHDGRLDEIDQSLGALSMAIANVAGTSAKALQQAQETSEALNALQQSLQETSECSEFEAFEPFDTSGEEAPE